jgi:adenine-specific DNA-methyltransferase
MPSLDFKGKSFVYTHHLSVPFRELVVDAKRSLPVKGEKPSLDDNLIIHGDNLHALKALLPVYAGKVDCIFIDPPYNTGNEGWCYNDNVRSPLMKEWLKKEANPVDKEDLERHDKWLSMMWPRLQLLRELLAEDGSIFVTIDDNESHRLRCLMDEVFGAGNFVSAVAWHKRVSPANDAQFFSTDHDLVMVYAKNAQQWRPNKLDREDDGINYMRNPDSDSRGPWNSGTYTCNKSAEERPNLYYAIVNPNTGEEVWPKKTAVWRFSQERHKENARQKLVYWGVDGRASMPRFKKFCQSEGLVPRSVWTPQDAGSTQEATSELNQILPGNRFPSPKPRRLVEKVLEIATDGASLVLDSFAGSATTAHAVLALNERDGGERRFVLVETEDYADDLTAERVRRVIKGYAFEGTQREELHREPLTYTKLKKAKDLIEKVEGIEMMAGKRFDRIKATVDDGELVVTGETDVKQKTKGLGGSFAFATLGPEMSIEALLTDGLPAFEALAKYVYYTATGLTLADVPKQTSKTFGYIGETESHRVHLLYKPEKAWLRSNDAALTERLVDEIVATNKTGKKTLVFAAAKFMGQRDLTKRGVDFCQLPYAIHRILGD